jgi:hypothetical protein
VPALPSSVLEPLWIQIAALLLTRRDTHPLGCHRPASLTGSASTSSSRSWGSAAGIAASPTPPARPRPCAAAGMSGSAPGVAEQLRLAVLAAYDRVLRLEREQLAVDGGITKAPCGGRAQPDRPAQPGTASARWRSRGPASGWRWCGPGQPPR